MSNWSRLFDTFNLTGADPTSAPFTLPGSSSTSASEATKNETAQAARDNAAAIQSVKDAQTAASSQAQAALNQRKRAMSGSQTIFTNPLGISGQANTAKKLLLGS